MPARGFARPASAKRAPWGTINRERIVDAATDLVRAGGYERMTIRSLAADLGVGPMSLYRHVRDKDDLLDAVVDRLLTRAWKPRRPPEEWRAWVIEASERFRNFLVSQPAALRVYLAHPVLSKTSLARKQAITAVLEGGLGDEALARRAFAAIQTYTIGFAALQASRSGWETSGHIEDEVVEELAAYTTPRQFLEGLEYLIAGIETAGSRRD